MKKLFLLIVCCLGLQDLRAAEVPPGVKEHPLVRNLLAEHYIHIHGEGRINVAYEKALAMLELEDVLTEIQRAYTDLLPEGEEAEFVITLENQRVYSFVNRKQQHTRIEELLRESSGVGGTDMVLYAEGVRGFGPFQSLTWIRVFPCETDPDVSEWRVQVYAFPQNSVSRFFARNLGIARRFFHRKTAEISELATGITLHLFNES